MYVHSKRIITYSFAQHLTTVPHKWDETLRATYTGSKTEDHQRGGTGSRYKIMQVYHPNHKYYCPASKHLAVSVWSHSQFMCINLPSNCKLVMWIPAISNEEFFSLSPHELHLQ